MSGFPPTLFANSKRQLQASLRITREQAVRQSIYGYALLFSDALPPQLLQEHDPTCRQRHYGHIPVFWAWLSQILEANASCSKALGLIQTWYRSSGPPVPQGDTSGYCSARMRLGVLQRDRNFDVADADGTGQANLFKYLAGLKPLDGSRFVLSIAVVPGQSGEKALTFSPVYDGRTYVLQFSPSLAPDSWQTLTTVSTNDSGNARTVTDLNAAGGQRFYRVRISMP